MFRQPLLKYACSFAPTPEGVSISYRGRQKVFSTGNPFGTMQFLSNCDGRTDVGAVTKASSLASTEVEPLLMFLEDHHLAVAGETTLRKDGLVSGAELFWRLEQLLLKWREKRLDTIPDPGIDAAIASGKAPISVVKGLFVEMAHLLRSVPDELACAVESAPAGEVQQAFMEFYEEECNHGRILTEALSSWFEGLPPIVNAVPLPTTVARMQTYKGWARKNVLLYATALMRDESSALDAEVPESEDIYSGMERHYDIPSIVVEKYRWHANLDRQLEHGFFPLRIFGAVEVANAQLIRETTSVLQQIVELHDLFRWGVAQYYARHDVESRFDRSARLFDSPSRGRAAA